MFCTQNNVFVIDEEPGGGELSLSACPGVGNRPPSENKIANPRGYARGGMVTGRIEPCIMWECAAVRGIVFNHFKLGREFKSGSFNLPFYGKRIRCIKILV